MSTFDIEKVLDQLTIEEKANLIAGIDFWHTYPVERLNIPSLRFSDGPNGIRGTKFFNSVPGAVLPNGTALASTFDKHLASKAGYVIGKEAKSKSTHVNLGPTTNIQRGPNGGRGFESFSEDPYLTGLIASSLINGIQNEKIAATIKHFLGNDLEDERQGSDSIVTQRALREIYLEPFRLAVKYSNPKAFMTGYNKINGIHISQRKDIINDILREEWNWDGTIMSDWFGTYTSKDSIEAGLDIEMPGPARFRTVDVVSQQIGSREVNINDLNDRVRGVLKLIKFGIESGIPENGPETTDNNTKETSSILREIASNAIVLLKNDDNILPIKSSETVAVIGPNAKAIAYAGGGSASLKPYYVVTPYDGIANKLGSKPKYSIGAYSHKSLPALGPQLKNPITGEIGYHATFYSQPPEIKNRVKFHELDSSDSLNHFADFKHDAIKDYLFFADFEGIFIPETDGDYEFGISVGGTAQLFVNDKLVVDNKTKQTLGVFFGACTQEERGSINLKAGNEYKVRIEFGSGPTTTLEGRTGDFTGSGTLIFGGAKVIDPIKEIANAVELAKTVDKPILVIGLNGEWESEAYDRANLDLPGYTNDLVRAVIKANPNTIIVNQSGTPVEFPWIKDSKAVLQAWFGGNELGNAIADVLFGDVNPSGRLPLTFPIKFQDNPAYLNFKTERGRVLYGEDIFVGYRFYEKLQRKVLFPFGYGLSYTTFEFKGLNVSVDEANNKLVIQLTVTNTGSVKGKETVQIYVSKDESDVIRPIKELKGFEKIELEAGESKSVKVELSLKDSISFFDEYENKWSAQAGDYQVQVGKSSDDIELIQSFVVKNSKLWLGL